MMIVRIIAALTILCASASSSWAFVHRGIRIRIRIRIRSTATPTTALDTLAYPHPPSWAPESSSAHLQEADTVNIGVLLLNLGGPEKGDDVEGWLLSCFVCLVAWSLYFFFFWQLRVPIF